MPAFSVAISSRVGPRYSTWSIATLVTTATWPSTTLVASHVPPRPTSTTATSTASSANHRSAARDQHLEVRRVEADLLLDERRRAQSCSSSVGVVDRLAVDRHALVDALADAGS